MPKAKNLRVTWGSAETTMVRKQLGAKQPDIVVLTLRKLETLQLSAKTREKLVKSVYTLKRRI